MLRPPGAGIAQESQSTRGMIVGLVVVALLFAVATVVELVRARDEAYRRATVSVQNLATSVARDIEHVVGSYDRSLQATIAALALPGFDQVSEPLRQQALFDGAIEAAYVGVEVIADAEGKVIAHSAPRGRAPVSIADRAAFTEQRERSDLGLYISSPFRSKADNTWAIGLSRRISGPDGRFAGVVMGTLRHGYFRDLAGQLNVEDGGSLAMVSTGGVLLTRIPWREDAIGANLAGFPSFTPMLAADHGTFEATAAIDGEHRLYGFKHVGGFPLVASSAVAVSAIYDSWWREAAIIGSATLVVNLILLVIAASLCRELRRRGQAEREVAATADRFRMIVDAAGDIILRLSLDGTRQYVSPAIESVLGYTPEELVGQPWEVTAHPDDRAAMTQALVELRQGAGHLTVKYRAPRKDGEMLWLEARIGPLRNGTTGEPEEFIAVVRDATWQARFEDELAVLATTDGLTGAATRRGFDESLASEWRRAQRDGCEIALLMLDADCFKAFNDCYGHIEGDRVLQRIVGSLREATRRAGDLVARYGGEEFAALLPNTDLAGTLEVGERIRAAVQALAIPHKHSPYGVVTVSVGAASLMPRFEDSSAALVQAADAALYQAKHTGRNRVAAVAVAESDDLAAD